MTDAIATTEAATTDAAVEKVELTLDQKIEQAEARLAKLRQQKLTESLLSNIERGDKVTVKFGRADKVRNIEGEVVGVALPNIVVLGADLETVKVHVRDVIANPSAEARTGVADVSDISSVDGRRPEEAGAAVLGEARVDEDDHAIATLEGEGGIVAADVDPLENA
jgi:preprotein translocase subunit YajC